MGGVQSAILTPWLPRSVFLRGRMKLACSGAAEWSMVILFQEILKFGFSNFEFSSGKSTETISYQRTFGPKMVFCLVGWIRFPINWFVIPGNSWDLTSIYTSSPEMRSLTVAAIRSLWLFTFSTYQSVLTILHYILDWTLYSNSILNAHAEFRLCKASVGCNLRFALPTIRNHCNF